MVAPVLCQPFFVPLSAIFTLITLLKSLFPSSSASGYAGVPFRTLSLYFSEMPLFMAAICVFAFATMASLLVKKSFGIAIALKTPSMTMTNIISIRVKALFFLYFPVLVSLLSLL